MLAVAQAGAYYRVFQAIFKAYSRLQLTKNSDRPIAVAGIQQRMAKAMCSNASFGIFSSFDHLHRSLL